MSETEETATELRDAVYTFLYRTPAPPEGERSILDVFTEFVAAREAAAADGERARLADRMAVLAEQADDPEWADFLREAAAWTRATKMHRAEVSR